MKLVNGMELSSYIENFTNTIPETISDTSKSKSSMKTQSWNVKLDCITFCVRWQEQANFFIKNEYDLLCPSDSAPPRIYGTPRTHKFSSPDRFPKLRQIVSSIGTFNYNLTDLLST